jgi:hypothetical protein
MALAILRATVALAPTLIAGAEGWVGRRRTCHEAKRQQRTNKQCDESLPHDCSFLVLG